MIPNEKIMVKALVEEMSVHGIDVDELDLTAKEYQSLLIAREQAANTARQIAAERVAEQVSQAERVPASGGMPYDLDPITGRLRAADRGLKGATPDTMANTGNSLAGAGPAGPPGPKTRARMAEILMEARK